ncbi:MAG: GIY-YIG nuclease family protein [Minwuia sp.]|uniref:GIY-YIG nuclease family protein n=1 Tax=Minwuia sp. TaxID=2493630 RepID=UPI003A896C9C
MRRHRYFVYILSNKYDTTLYIGFTNDLRRRLTEHREKLSEFSSKYRLTKLVYFEEHQYVLNARQRERTLKHWNREWKDKLVSDVNPDWRDLSDQIPLD